jgi:hypothetical protein
MEPRRNVPLQVRDFFRELGCLAEPRQKPSAIVQREHLELRLQRFEASPDRNEFQQEIADVRDEIARLDRAWEIYELFLRDGGFVALYAAIEQLPYDDSSVTFVREMLGARLSDYSGERSLLDANQKYVRALGDSLSRVADEFGEIRRRRILLPGEAVSIRHLLLAAAAMRDTHRQMVWSERSAHVLGKSPVRGGLTCRPDDSSGIEAWLYAFDGSETDEGQNDDPTPEAIWAFAPDLEEILRRAGYAMQNFEIPTLSDPAVPASRKFSAKSYFLRDVLSRLVVRHKWDAGKALTQIVAKAATILLNNDVVVKDVERALATVRQAHNRD